MLREGLELVVLRDGVGHSIGGFQLLDERAIDYLGMHIGLYRHVSGLEVLSIDCADVENSFIAGFRTPNNDNTGVQHVVEHVSLGGSRNFQVKGPCDELSRGSLATYINAETYLDRTLYPYASLHEAEFRNGLMVYLDGVFNPLLRKETFMQEGWRYELSRGPSGHVRLSTTGIVLNERRAQLNDMSDVALGAAYAHLLPGHPLSWDSGGLPGVIETLTYERFLDYYRSHYALARGRLFFYGNIPTEQKLSWVADYIDRHCDFSVSPSISTRDGEIVPVAPWRSPRSAVIPIAADAEDVESGSGWTMNWHVGQLLGKGERLGMELLSMLLLEDDSSPLRRCLQESGCCEDLIDCSGLETEHGECLFVVGVVNCSERDWPTLRTICLGCLSSLADKGFSTSHVRATYNQLCLRYQEIPNGFGLQVGRQIMRNWLSGQDPLLGVDYRASFAELDQVMHDDPHFLVGLLSRMLVKNSHRVELCLQADAGLQARRQAEQESRCKQILKRMTADELKVLESDLQAWKTYQDAGDSPEALASFPHLGREQLPSKPFDPDVERCCLANGLVALRGDIPSPGVNYVKLGYDVSLFNSQELELLPIFVCLLDSVGVQGHHYGAFERQLAAAGAELDLDVQMESVNADVLSVLTVKLGALETCWSKALDCLQARMHRSILTEKGHMREVLRQCWSQAGQKLYSDDDSLDYVIGRSGAGVSERESLYEAWYGIEGVRRLARCRRLLKARDGELERVWEGMLAKLSLATPTMVSYVGNDRGYDEVVGRLSNLGMVGGGLRQKLWIPDDCKPALGRREWIKVAKHGSCCVRSFRGVRYDDSRWAPLSVYCELLSEGYLQEAIRMTGGAYGGGCSYSPASGLIQMYSYSDPRPAETLKVFQKALGKVEDWTDGQVVGAIVGCVRGDVPLRASEGCSAIMTREIIGLSNAARRRRREQLLAVSVADVRAAAGALEELAEQGWNDCVAGEESPCGGETFAPVSWGR